MNPRRANQFGRQGQQELSRAGASGATAAAAMLAEVLLFLIVIQPQM
jgi:hypothetical protein